jgi:hypothetical protein
MLPTANDKYGVSSMAEGVIFTAFPLSAAQGVNSGGRKASMMPAIVPVAPH